MSTRPESEYRSFFGNLTSTEDDNDINYDKDVKQKSVVHILQRLPGTIKVVGYGIFTILVVGGVTACLFVCLRGNDHQYADHPTRDSSSKQIQNLKESKPYLRTKTGTDQRNSGLLLGFSKYCINSSSLDDDSGVILFQPLSESPNGPYMDYDTDKGIFTARVEGIYDVMMTFNIDTYSKDPHQEITPVYYWLRSTCLATGSVDYTESKWRVAKRTTQTLTLYNIYHLNAGDTLQVGVNEKRFIYNDKSMNYLIIRVFS